MFLLCEIACLCIISFTGQNCMCSPLIL
jgi:hypothetical protein